MNSIYYPALKKPIISPRFHNEVERGRELAQNPMIKNFIYSNETIDIERFIEALG
ncbi:hypothetical protein pb186bvf_016700 [Paramecium bursaria]